ncbi:predicted protein [Postia placenta Mad-698-R]|nr:predicted protein [Postia placenta Mad-698-R]
MAETGRVVATDDHPGAVRIVQRPHHTHSNFTGLPSDPWGARPHPKLARPWPRPPIRAVVAFLIRMRLPARVVSGTDGKESQSGDLAASPPRGWTTMEIATPIMVGFFVAAIAATVFVYYRHRLRHPPSIHRPAPVTVSCWDRFRLRMPGWVFGVLPGTHAVRPGNTHKPSTWSIDDADNIPLHAPQASSSTSSSGSGPGSGSGSLSRSGFASHSSAFRPPSPALHNVI